MAKQFEIRTNKMGFKVFAMSKAEAKKQAEAIIKKHAYMYGDTINKIVNIGREFF